jgi:cell division transport system permease protein
VFVRNSLYLLGEAFRNLLRNSWMTIASIAVVAITLLLLGSFILLNYNIELITENIEDQVEIVLYVQEQAGERAIDSLRERLIRHSQIAEVRFVSKQEAMERLKKQFGEQAHFLEGYEQEEENPLRHSFEIKTKVPEMIGEVAEDLQTYPWVEDVYYGSEIVDNLFRFTTAVRIVGLAFMIALGITAMFLIAHTIRVKVFIRSREIMIMKYVGATEWFIRWPFLIEGLVMGLTGAALSLLIIYYGYQAVVEWANSYIYFVPVVPYAQAVYSLLLILLPLGIGLGIFGSAISMRRFLKV